MSRLPLSGLLAGAGAAAVTAAAIAGFTPWGAVTALPGSLATPALLAFWCLLAGGIPAALMFYHIRRRCASGTPCPEKRPVVQWLIGMILIAITISISARTFPANIIKAGLFDLLLPIAAVLLAWRRKHLPPAVTALLPPLLLLAAIWLCSTFLAVDTPRSGLLLLRAISYVVWFAVVAAAFPAPAAALLFWRLLAALAVGVSAYGILQAADLDPAQWGRGFSLPDLQVTARAMATFGNPNFFGAFLTVTVPLLFRELAVAATPRLRWLCAGLLLLPLAGMLFSYNRAGYLGLLAAGTVFIAAAGIPWRRPLMTAGILLLAVVFVSPDSVRQRVWFWQHGLRGDDSVRLAIWSSAAQLIAARPVWGSGPGSFNEASAPFLPYEYHRIYRSPQYIIEHAHSELLELWAETGTAGFAAALLLLAVTVRLLWQRRRTDPGCYSAAALAALAGALVHALFETKLRYVSTAVPLLFIIATALASGSPPAAVQQRRHPWGWVAATFFALALLQGWTALQANLEVKTELDIFLTAQQSGNNNGMRDAEAALNRALALDPQQFLTRYKELTYRTVLQQLPYDPEPPWRARAAFRNYQDAALLMARSQLLQNRPLDGIPLVEHYRMLYPLDERVPLLQAELFNRAGIPLAAMEMLCRIPASQRDKPDYYATRAHTLRTTAERHPGIAAACRQLALATYRDAAERFPGAAMLRVPLLTDAVEQNDLAGAFAHFRALAEIPATGNAPAPAVKQLIEKLINRLLADPAAARLYLLPCGDLLAAMHQPQQALIVYHAAGRVGVPQERIISRIACLALRSDMPDILEQTAAQLQELPATRLSGLYLAARAKELRQQPQAAIALARQVLAEESLHLGAIALLKRLNPARGSAAAALLASARAQLGTAYATISDSDPRWTVAVASFATTDSLTVTGWVTPHLPDSLDGEWLAGTDGDRRLYSAGRRLQATTPGSTRRLEFAIGLTSPRQEVFPLHLATYLIWHNPSAPLPPSAVPYPAGTLPLPATAPGFSTSTLLPPPLVDGDAPSPPVRQLARLDRLAASDSSGALPIAVWFSGMPRLQGDYWRRWLDTPLANRADFRDEVARQLLRQQRFSDARDWLRSTPSAIPTDRFLLARALAGTGDTAAAETLFTGAGSSERDPRFLWAYGRWLKSTGRGVQECVTALLRAGADGWATLLNGEMLGESAPNERTRFITHELPGGFYLLDLISGQTIRRNTSFSYELPLYWVSDCPANRLTLNCRSQSPEKSIIITLSTLRHGQLGGYVYQHRESLGFAAERRSYLPTLTWQGPAGTFPCGTAFQPERAEASFIRLDILPYFPAQVP